MPIVNHLWQSSIFAIAVWLLTLALNRHGAAVRYWLWLAASVKFLIPFSILVSLGRRFAWQSDPQVRAPRLSMLLDTAGQPFHQSLYGAAAIAPATSDLAALLMFIWIAGIAISAAILLRSWLRLRALGRAAEPLTVDTAILVLECAEPVEPGVFGILHPVILLPCGLRQRLSADEFASILTHELAHVRRRDNFTGAIHMMVEAIFWFHPLLWWIRTRLIEERELACDEEVLRSGAEPEVYAEGLLRVCKLSLETPMLCVSGITGADLKRRVTRIMTDRPRLPMSGVTKALVAIATAATILIPIVAGAAQSKIAQSLEQSTPREFDAVSIKPMQQQSTIFAVTWHVDPKMINIGAEFLQTYVEQAYSLKPYQVVLKGAEWIKSERYDIQARTSEPASEPEMMLMLRKTLADRFHLRVHRETREMPVYFLNVDRRGIKMHEATVTTGPNLSFHLTDVDATHLAMVDFVDILSTFVTDRPVLDRTELKPEYQFKLEFAPRDASPDNPSDRPSIFAALPEQLGLKLEAGKAPVEVLVIDRAERPQAN